MGEMDAVFKVLLLTTVAGGAIPAGGLLAWVERIRPRWLERELRHGVIAFGGGVLLSAVALVLVPEGNRQVSLWVGVPAMLIGGLAAMAMDMWLAKRGGSGAQLAAMLADFVPEAMALGAMIAAGASTALLLALLIALQNLPEGFNAFREVTASGMARRRAMRWFVLLSLLGPAAGLLGHYVLASHRGVLGAVMLAASGAILYLIFEDIAPQAKLERKWGPPLGAVLGFLVGVIGQGLVG